MLFGGVDDSGIRRMGDTWEWDGQARRKLSALAAAQIPSRFFHEAALDTRRKRVVVFGGSPGSGALADLWEWDGRRWLEIEQPLRH